MFPQFIINGFGLQSRTATQIVIIMRGEDRSLSSGFQTLSQIVLHSYEDFVELHRQQNTKSLMSVSRNETEYSWFLTK